MAPVLQTRTERRGRNDAAGSAAAGAGAVTATGGLVGGGIPGFRADSDTIRNLRQGGWRQRTGAALSSGRGGVFGYRIDAHQGALDRFKDEEKRHAKSRISRSNAFLRGRGSGKIQPEVDIIRHLKRGRRASNIALVGGGALTAGGAHQTRRGDLSKAQRDTERYHGALLGTGGTAAAASLGGERILRGQSRRWAEREAESLRAAEKIVPNLKTTVSDSGAVRNPKVLSGKSKAEAEAAGRHRGAAAQERYFSRVYGGTANVARRIRNPALATAAVGGGGLLLGARNADTTGRRPLAKSAGDEMPYKSDRQRRFMHARHPGIARRWDDEIRESRKQSSYGGSGGHGRKVDVDKRDNYRGPDQVQGAGVAGMGGVIGLTGAGNYYGGRVNRNIAQAEGELMVARGRGRYVPYEGARVLNDLKQAKQTMRRGKYTALAGLGVTGLGGGMVVADRRAQAARRRERLARKDTASKAYRSHDPEAARQRRLGAGVATTGIVGTALAGAGGRRAFKLTRALRTAPLKMPARSQLTDEQARALETLRHKPVVVADRKALAMVGGGSATGLGSAALARHAQNDRNRRWT